MGILEDREIKEDGFDALLKLIKDYYKERNIDLDTERNIILEDRFNKGADLGPFYITHGTIGLVSFFLSPKNIQKIIENNTEPLDVVYSSSMGYDRVRDIINDYYFKKEGKRIVFVDIRKLKETINKGISFIGLTNEGEEIEITIDTIKSIISDHCKNKGFNPIRIQFDEQVLLKFVGNDYHENKKVTKETKQVSDNHDVKKVEPISDNHVYTGLSGNDSNEPNNDKKNTSAEVTPIDNKNESSTSLYNDDGTLVALDIPMPDMPITSDSLDKLVDYEKVKVDYEMERRKTIIMNAQAKQKKYAVLTAICMTCAIITAHSRINELNKSAKDVLEDIQSWDTTIEYVNDLGPVPTILTLLTAYNTLQYVRNMEKVKRVDRDQQDYCDMIIKHLTKDNKKNRKKED